MIQPNREARRAGSRRERRRSVKAKAERFYDLRDKGASPSTIAAALGQSVQSIDELLEIAEETEAVEVGGGGG
jgi:hypothetical protein